MYQWRPLEILFIYLGNKEIDCIFKTCHISLFHFPQNSIYLIILSCSIQIMHFFINHVLKFKYSAQSFEGEIPAFKIFHSFGHIASLKGTLSCSGAVPGNPGKFQTGYIPNRNLKCYNTLQTSWVFKCLCHVYYYYCSETFHLRHTKSSTLACCLECSRDLFSWK
jgi:hypothetical protein